MWFFLSILFVCVSIWLLPLDRNSSPKEHFCRLLLFMKHKRKRTIYYCEKGFYVIVFATLFFFALSYCVCCCWTHKSGFNSLCDLWNDEKMMENSKWEKSVSTQKNVLLKSIRLWQPLLILRSSNRIENNGENTIRKLKTHSNFQFNPISTTFQCFQCLKEKCLIYFSYSTFH